MTDDEQSQTGGIGDHGRFAIPRVKTASPTYTVLAFPGLGAVARRPDWGAMAWEYRTCALAAPRHPVVPVLKLAALAMSLRSAPGRVTRS